MGLPGSADLLNLLGIVVFLLLVGTLGALAALVVAKEHADLAAAIVEFEAPSAVPDGLAPSG